MTLPARPKVLVRPAAVETAVVVAVVVEGLEVLEARQTRSLLKLDLVVLLYPPLLQSPLPPPPARDSYVVDACHRQDIPSACPDRRWARELARIAPRASMARKRPCCCEASL